tara:strand:- start:1193 stop:1393 length:201 start_codon:yes stop_codon:yes gene_type:complete
MKHCKDKVVNALILKHIDRAEQGERKFGNTYDEVDRSVEYLVRNALEECMDMSVYLQKLLEVIKNE